MGGEAPKPLRALRLYVREALPSILLAAGKPGALPALRRLVPPFPTLRLLPRSLFRAASPLSRGRPGKRYPESRAGAGLPSGCPGCCPVLRVPGGLDGRSAPGRGEAAALGEASLHLRWNLYLGVQLSGERWIIVTDLCRCGHQDLAGCPGSSLLSPAPGRSPLAGKCLGYLCF